MFIFNINLSKNKILKFSIVLLLLLLIFFCIRVVIHYTNSSDKVYVKDTVDYGNITEITSNNYTNILKDCNENPSDYFGKKIKFSGFVYRLYDFSDNQFVLAREMIVDKISNDTASAVVVGFLCESSDISSFDDYTWVEIEGTISKGFYHSDIPIVKISSIKKVSAPENSYVYPPDNGYVHTENI